MLENIKYTLSVTRSTGVLRGGLKQMIYPGYVWNMKMLYKWLNTKKIMSLAIIIKITICLKGRSVSKTESSEAV